VKAYFDTPVLVASCVESHEHFFQARGLLRQVHEKKIEGVMSCHGLAECFAVLTRPPYAPTLDPARAWQLLSHNILSGFELVTLSPTEYQDAVQRYAGNGWGGARLYDWLHIETARKSNCETIYTFNIRHFRQLAPDLGDQIKSS
jgi:predicted nucleic acid-binding protein